MDSAETMPVVADTPVTAAGVPTMPVLSVQDVSKRFGATTALTGVSFACRPGEVHAVLGENGSGKSTLLGIASGVLAPDTGTVTIAGQPLHTASPALARSLGVGMAFQTYSLVSAMTVAENLVLERPPHTRLLSPRTMRDWAQQKLAEFELPIDAGARVDSLSLADRQMLEVVKAAMNEPTVLLLDEPTTALGPDDVERLHELVLRQVRRGVGVVYVSHRLPEILHIADRVTVLRDGELAGTHAAAELDEHGLLSLMIGRPVELAFPPRRRPETARAGDGAAPGGAAEDDTGGVLEVRGLHGPRFGPVDLAIARGEIVGIAGAEGNGQSELVRAIAGALPATGTVRCTGNTVRRRAPGAALRGGVMLLSGERLRESLFPVLGVRANATVQALATFARGGFVSRSRETRAMRDVAAALRVRTASVEQPVRFLSGGNQQKVVISRLLLRDVAVLVVEEPTQGVDVRSRFEIYEALREMTDRGLAVLVKSSDPVELAGLCDRVLVMSRGRITEELSAEELSEERIVGAFVRSRHSSVGDAPPTASPNLAGRIPAWWFPPAVMVLVTLLAGGYVSTRSPAFLGSFNLNSLFESALPLGVVAVAQLSALLVGEFDLSVGALMALVVVIGSFVLGSSSLAALVGGIGAAMAICAIVGIVNAGLVRVAAIPSIIATIGTLSVLQGISLILRPTPAGLISSKLAADVGASIGPLPYALIGTIVLVVALDIWLHHTRSGLITRAVGLDATSSARVGAPAPRLRLRAMVLASLLAGVAGLFLAAQVGVGDPSLGGSFTLSSIAAAILGGASLTGGRGSFTGALIGALFLSLIVNALPILGWSSAVGDISRGAVTLVALAVFQGGSVLATRWKRRAG